MKARNTITKLIAITMMVATGLLNGGGLLQPAKAQTGNDTVRFVSYASTGIVHGEKIRLSIANTGATGSSSLSFWINISSGETLYESEWIKVPAKEFRVAEVSRDDLKTEGDPETGRAQVIVTVNIIAPAGSNEDDFPTSLEVFQDEVQNGETVKPDSKYRLIILAAKRSQLNAPIGFDPGERLRYTFFYPTEEGDQPVRVTTYVYDSYGNVAKQTDPVVLRPGDAHIFDINRDDLRVPGDDGMGHLQVRSGIQVALMDGSVRPVKLLVSMEVVNNRTGSTSGGNYYCGTVTVSGD